MNSARVHGHKDNGLRRNQLHLIVLAAALLAACQPSPANAPASEVQSGGLLTPSQLAEMLPAT